jgi:hypothetical protein
MDWESRISNDELRDILNDFTNYLLDHCYLNHELYCHDTILIVENYINE